jgi:hypothetical protein
MPWRAVSALSPAAALSGGLRSSGAPHQWQDMPKANQQQQGGGPGGRACRRGVVWLAQWRAINIAKILPDWAARSRAFRKRMGHRPAGDEPWVMAAAVWIGRNGSGRETPETLRAEIAHLRRLSKLIGDKRILEEMILELEERLRGL